MLNKNLLKACLSATALLSSLALNGQAMGAPTMPTQLSSPVVNPDNTVTFNYQAPNAKKVQVSTQFAGTQDMTKNEKGVWSITLGPVTPDIYPYSFIVDGIQNMDPLNPDWFPNEKFKNSLLDVRGNEDLNWHPNDVAHGAVDYTYFHSSTLDIEIPVVIYTPAGYDKSDKSYPVFYLISGTTDTEETFFKVGKANFIEDNLVAQGKAKEMIIVMPYGNPNYLRKDSNHAPLEMGRVDSFSKDFINDLMPFVEANYRTINTREARTIAGFSRGGRQAINLGLANFDKFASILSYSSYTSSMEFERTPSFYEDIDRTNKDLKLFWLGVDKADFLYGSATEFMELLDKYKINNTQRIYEGYNGHTWMAVKRYLNDTLPLLFQ